MIRDIYHSAIHEAGHAVMAWYYGILAEEIYVTDNYNSVCILPPPMFFDAEEEVCIALAGPLAEKRYLKIRGNYLPSSEGDINNAIETLKLHGIQKPELYLLFASLTVKRYLRNQKTWLAISKIADALMLDNLLNEQNVLNIFKSIKPPQKRNNRRTRSVSHGDLS